MIERKIGDRRWDEDTDNGDWLLYEWDGIQWLLIAKETRSGTPIWSLER